MGTRKRIAIEQDPAVELSRRLLLLWAEYDNLVDADDPNEVLEQVTIDERDTVERRLALTQATSLDGALAQLVLAHAHAGLLIDIQEFGNPEFERQIKEGIEALIRSAVRVLVRLGGDMSTVPSAYVGPKLRLAE